MKTLLASRSIVVPEGVEIEVNARTVKVTGPRGSLVRDFKHMTMDLVLVKPEEPVQSAEAGEEEVEYDPNTYLKVDLWFATRKQLACVRTICSHIENMFVGVTQGFVYKMRFVYSHFPINVNLSGDVVEIRNFLGEKRVRKVKLLEGVSFVRTAAVKDQIELSGNDIAAVSLTAAKIQQTTNVRKKDLRKFLDGIYVSEKGPIPKEE